MIETQEILNCAQAFHRCHILVVGDLMLDEYLWGHIERISAEAPVPILNVVRREATLGGAGNVANNLRALGVEVSAVGIVGQDETGDQIRELLKGAGVDMRGVIGDPNRKSTRKVRLMSLEHGQQVFRMDEESVQEANSEVEDQLIARVIEVAPRAQIILCSDYMKGALTKHILEVVFNVARKRGLVSLVGPKDPNTNKYDGATILMPNLKELALMTQSSIDGSGWLTSSAKQLFEKLNLEALVVTKGSAGMSLFESHQFDLRRVDIPTMARSVYDVTGAGDTAISTFAAAIAGGVKRDFAVYLANVAAGIKVARRGTASVTAEELQTRLNEQEARPGEPDERVRVNASSR